jgi:hypothetical protein
MFIRGLLRINAGYAYSQLVINRAHPVRVSPSKVVINRNQVATLPGEGIEVEGEGSYQGFALTGFHLGNFALVKDNASH